MGYITIVITIAPTSGVIYPDNEIAFTPKTELESAVDVPASQLHSDR